MDVDLACGLRGVDVLLLLTIRHLRSTDLILMKPQSLSANLRAGVAARLTKDFRLSLPKAVEPALASVFASSLDRVAAFQNLKRRKAKVRKEVLTCCGRAVLSFPEKDAASVKRMLGERVGEILRRSGSAPSVIDEVRRHAVYAAELLMTERDLAIPSSFRHYSGRQLLQQPDSHGALGCWIWAIRGVTGAPSYEDELGMMPVDRSTLVDWLKADHLQATLQSWLDFVNGSMLPLLRSNPPLLQSLRNGRPRDDTFSNLTYFETHRSFVELHSQTVADGGDVVDGLLDVSSQLVWVKGPGGEPAVMRMIEVWRQCLTLQGLRMSTLEAGNCIPAFDMIFESKMLSRGDGYVGYFETDGVRLNQLVYPIRQQDVGDESPVRSLERVAPVLTSSNYSSGLGAGYQEKRLRAMWGGGR